jgi:hypothetical protein
MREIRGHVTDIDRHLEEVLRAKQQFPTITSPILRLASIPSRLSAALRPRAAGLTALTGLSVEPGSALT